MVSFFHFAKCECLPEGFSSTIHWKHPIHQPADPTSSPRPYLWLSLYVWWRIWYLAAQSPWWIPRGWTIANLPGFTWQPWQFGSPATGGEGQAIENGEGDQQFCRHNNLGFCPETVGFGETKHVCRFIFWLIRITPTVGMRKSNNGRFRSTQEVQWQLDFHSQRSWSLAIFPHPKTGGPLPLGFKVGMNNHCETNRKHVDTCCWFPV